MIGLSGRTINNAGVTSNLSIIIYKILPSGEYGDYAVLTGTQVYWGTKSVLPPAGDSLFGAAYTYDGCPHPRVFFTANEGWGLFEVKLPLYIPDSSCWNAQSSLISSHVACPNSGASISFVSEAAQTRYNDGFSCYGDCIDLPDTNFFEDPSEFNCTTNTGPIQVFLPTTSTQYVDPYEVGELDLATGEYVLLYHLDQIPLRCVSFLA